MENKHYDKIVDIISYIVILAVLLVGIITPIDDIHANAQEPNTITLKAGTYMFNDVINLDGLALPYFANLFYSSFNGSYNSMKLLMDGESPIIWYEESQDDETYLAYYGQDGGWYDNEAKLVTLPTDTVVDYTFGTWYISSTNYNTVNGDNSIIIPYTNVNITTDIQIMENINMDINGFGSTASNDNVGISALNGDTLGRIRTNDDTFISFNGIAVTSFDSWRTLSTYVYPLTDDVIATQPFTISNGLMLYVWDDTQYYQVAWYNPADELWYVHGDYSIIVPYGHRSTQGIGTLTDGIAISLSITPNLTADDIGYVELGGFEDTPPYDNIITVADEDAYSTFAMFCNANFISDSEKLSWGIAQHQSGQNLGQSQQLGDNILGQFLQAPIDILDSIVIYTTPNGTAVTLMGVFGALLTLSLVIIFLKLFAGG